MENSQKSEKYVIVSSNKSECLVFYSFSVSISKSSAGEQREYSLFEKPSKLWTERSIGSLLCFCLLSNKHFMIGFQLHLYSTKPWTILILWHIAFVTLHRVIKNFYRVYLSKILNQVNGYVQWTQYSEVYNKPLCRKTKRSLVVVYIFRH